MARELCCEMAQRKAEGIAMQEGERNASQPEGKVKEQEADGDRRRGRRNELRVVHSDHQLMSSRFLTPEAE